MNTLGYFVIMAAAMLVLSRVLPGLRVDGWSSALIAALLLAALNTVLKPILFVLTLPLTIVTLGLFLLVLNALMLWITAAIVPGFDLLDFGTTLVASLVLAVVGALWKGLTGGGDKKRKQRKRDDD